MARAILLVALVGCGDATTVQVTWTIETSEALRASGARLYVAIHEGSCDARGALRHEELYGPDDTPREPPLLDAGGHAFVAQLRDGECAVLAEGCTDYGGGAEVLVTLAPSSASCARFCEPALCREVVDAGTDVDDSGAPADAGLECGSIPGVVLEGGGAHTCMLAPGGEMLCWGNAARGQLGYGEAIGFDVLPRLVDDVPDIRHLATGQLHTCAIDEDGDLRCAGAAPFATFDGLGDDVSELTEIDTSRAWTALAAGYRATCAAGDGALRCWGESDAQLAASGLTLATFSMGDGFGCGFDTARVPTCWGDNSRGQLGRDVCSDCGDPIRPLPFVAQLVAVSAGRSHVCGIREVGAALTLSCWGANERGQLGTGDTDDRDRITRVGTRDQWLAVVSAHPC